MAGGFRSALIGLSLGLSGCAAESLPVSHTPEKPLAAEVVGPGAEARGQVAAAMKGVKIFEMPQSADAMADSKGKADEGSGEIPESLKNRPMRSQELDSCSPERRAELQKMLDEVGKNLEAHDPNAEPMSPEDLQCVVLGIGEGAK